MRANAGLPFPTLGDTFCHMNEAPAWLAHLPWQPRKLSDASWDRLPLQRFLGDVFENGEEERRSPSVGLLGFT